MAAKRIDTQGKAGHIITPAQPLEHFNITAPASEGAIQKFEQLFGLVLPEDYVTFLKKSNGGEGFVGDNAYLILSGVRFSGRASHSDYAAILSLA